VKCERPVELFIFSGKICLAGQNVLQSSMII
jgi:hypothetical protein